MKRPAALVSTALLVWAGEAAAVERRDEPRGDDVPARYAERDRDPGGWYLPDYGRLQTGGFTGLVALGLGYAAFDDILNVTLLYGFTPEVHAGHDVHSLELALDGRPFDIRVEAVRFVPVYVGVDLLYAFGDSYFVRVAERYRRIDETYYPPTALHWGVHLGAEVDWIPPAGFVERHGLYYEAGTVDTFLFAYAENPDRLTVWDALASTIGYRAAW